MWRLVEDRNEVRDTALECFRQTEDGRQTGDFQSSLHAADVAFGESSGPGERFLGPLDSPKATSAAWSEDSGPGERFLGDVSLLAHLAQSSSENGALIRYSRHFVCQCPVARLYYSTTFQPRLTRID